MEWKSVLVSVTIVAILKSSTKTMLGSSGMWEKVNHLSVQDELQMQILELHKELVETKKNIQKNAQGIDLENGRAVGVWRIKVLGAEELSLDGILDLASNPTIVATLSIASASVEKGKNYIRSGKTDPTPIDNVTRRCFWNKGTKSVIEFCGVKTKKATGTLTLHHPSPLVADVFVGTCKLEITDELLNQNEKTMWIPLSGPPAQTNDGVSYGQVQVAVSFEYDRVARLEKVVAELETQKANADAEAAIFHKTAPLINAESRHPAAFGQAAFSAGLYIPGHRFSTDIHHPAAVAKIPIADGSKVVTPFGRGTVVTFREATRMYVILMEASPGQKKRYTTAYLREECVEDAPELPRLRPGIAVSTPYGPGTIIESRNDSVIVVKTDYATMYMQSKDVELTESLKATNMTNKERIDAAVAGSTDGNAAFKAEALEDAISHYLKSLQFLQHVDQDNASHKEKAVVLQTMIRCHLNLAACKLKLQAHSDAWTACTNALAILQALTENRTGKVAAWMGRLGMTEVQIFNEWPSKARFRRATALVAMGNDTEARQDLMAAVKLMPKDKACRQLLETVTKRIALDKEKEKLRWGGFLVNSDSTAPTTSNASTPPPKTTRAVTPVKKYEDRSVKSNPRDPKEARESTWYQNTTVVAAVSVAVAGAAVMLISGLSKRNR